MITSHTMGNQVGRTEEPFEYLTLAFSPLSVPLRTRWRNNGISADFLSDYVTTFLPRNGDSSPAGAHQNQIRHAVSYIANELIENAMKYHENEIGTPIQVNLELTSDRVRISATNSVSAGQAEVYQQFVNKLLVEDPGDLLVRQLESAAESEDASGLGLVTMMTDYGAELGWQFDMNTEQRDKITVTTSAMFSIKQAAEVSA